MHILVIPGLIIFIILALYMFRFGVKKYAVYTKLKKDGRPVDAEVIAIKRTFLRHIPIFSFTDHNNKRQEGPAKNIIHIERFNYYRAGNRIKILYDPNDPSNFVSDQSPDRILPFLFCGVGLVFILVISYVLIMSML